MNKSVLICLLVLVCFTLDSCKDKELEPSQGILPPGEETVLLPQDTGLPVVEINTLSGCGLMDKETWVPALLRIPAYGNLKEISDTIYIKGRGNATWRFDKKAFNMKCSHRQSVLGMKKHKRWGFLANYHDRTLMRNELTFFIGQMCGGLEWTPNCRYAELILNGVHQGNYLITEHIRVDKNRVDIDELKPEDTSGQSLTGGYLLEIDHYYDRKYKFHTVCHALPVGVVSPDDDVIQPVQFEYIKSFFRHFDQILLYPNDACLFNDYADIESFIDYYIVQTLTGNHEMTAPRSVYCYKKRNGLLYAGPLWDFDFSTYNSPNEKMNTYSIWYRSMFRSQLFCERLKSRWVELRPIFEANILPHIDETATLLQKSQQLNFKLFPVSVSGGYKNGDENLEYNVAVQRLKDVVRQRILKMDAFMRTL